MTNVEMLKEMIQMQMALDSAIYDGNNVEYNEEKCYLALFDELGELNHELKKEWCWWKKTQKEVDRQRVLEELVDCYHFAMSIFYHAVCDEEVRRGILESNIFEKRCEWKLTYLYLFIIDDDMVIDILSNLYQLTIKLGFAMEDVYQEYKRKNQENYNRLARGY
jgi:dimeric dUTPase (all-alpha-NTP-PPase superfamily)